MKMNAPIVFVGPSLTREDRAIFPEVRFLAPAAQGDILRCIVKKPEAIGLIDGYFGDRLAVHQKEILEAMEAGIPVLGGGSMGALRAVELTRYGMQGVGAIFEAYRSGEINSDADVAVTHGPEELGFVATSISMVDVRATIAALRRRGIVSNSEQELILQSAASIHFSERTWSEIAGGVHQTGRELLRLQKILKESSIQQKRLDAIELVRSLKGTLAQLEPTRTPPPMTSYYQAIRSRAFKGNF